ncbi:MAG: YjgN family protein [Rubrivivax sp.]
MTPPISATADGFPDTTPGALPSSRASSPADAPATASPFITASSEGLRRGEVGVMPVRFIGSGSEYFRIWIVNLLLTIVTLGLYYPFAKARRLRYFHSHTEVGGHPLGFHGNPWVMFRGFLLIAALLVASQVTDLIQPGLGVVAVLVLGALWPVLWRSSLRFRMANTSWRGLRGQFDGSVGGAYFSQWPGLALAASFVALGVAAGFAAGPGKSGAPLWLGIGFLLLMLLSWLVVPALLLLANRYRVNHSVYAGETFQFEGRFGDFLKLTFKTLGVMLLGYLAIGALIGLTLAVFGSGGFTTAANEPLSAAKLLAMLPLIAAVLLAVLLGPLVLQPYLTARLQNLTWSHTQSPRLRFHSDLKVRQLILLRLKNGLLIALTLGLYLPFAKVAEARLRLSCVRVFHRVSPDALVSQGQRAHKEAAGDAAGDFMGFDVGL